MDKMTLTEKAAYIKGLMQGMKFEATSDEGKLIAALLDLTSDIADKVTILDEEVGDLFEEVDAMSADLSDVETFLAQDEEDDEELDMFDDELYEITCPACGEVICVDEEHLAAEDLACPNCETKFEVDFSDECGCGCCDDPDEDDKK